VIAGGKPTDDRRGPKPGGPDRGKLAACLIAGCILSAGETMAAEAGAIWSGPPLEKKGWTGLGVIDSVFAAYRRQSVTPPEAGKPEADRSKVAASKPRLWERLEYPNPVSDQSPPYRSYAALLEIDCQMATVTALQWTTYVGNNLSGAVAATIDSAGPPAFTVPGSIDDRLRRIACAAR
jgi:hypothetical protein